MGPEAIAFKVSLCGFCGDEIQVGERYRRVYGHADPMHRRCAFQAPKQKVLGAEFPSSRPGRCPDSLCRSATWEVGDVLRYWDDRVYHAACAVRLAEAAAAAGHPVVARDAKAPRGATSEAAPAGGRGRRVVTFEDADEASA